MRTTNYTNTLIAVAEDCTAERGIVPPEKEGNPSIAARTRRMIAEHPYTYTSDDVIFTVWADRKGIADGDRDAARTEFFSKGQPCLRASDLGKKYGWGIHHDAEGRVALYGVDTSQYRALAGQDGMAVVRAMRTSRRLGRSSGADRGDSPQPAADSLAACATISRMSSSGSGL